LPSKAPANDNDPHEREKAIGGWAAARSVGLAGYRASVDRAFALWEAILFGKAQNDA
jgi:hypothetical protein